jgi:uncharacterized protein (DUF305 family)
VSPVKRSGSTFVVLAAAFALAGCAGSEDEPEATGTPAPNIVQPGAPGEPAETLTPEGLDAIDPPRHTDADVAFMQGMIHHHAQALWMTRLVEKRSRSRGISLLARRIDMSQEAEIAQMQAWLKARGEEAPILHRRHGHAHGVGARLMPGMLTQSEMNRLQTSRGARFDRLFLESMIRHHQGAVQMVNQLFAEDSGAEPEAGAFARHVDADQQLEIARMQRMLGHMAAG